MSVSVPVPFRQFVLKVHSRCDLACDHCYMYEHADKSFLSRPKVLSLEMADLIGVRVADHARTHALDSVRIILHGGEPLLAGVGHLEGIIGSLRSALDSVVDVDFRIHTNGVRLDEKFLALFVDHGVKVGISLDGDRAANDRHRRYADGRTSHPSVLRALELLRRPEYRPIYAGILCTIDIRNDPIAVYEALLAEEPPNVGLLLPHATWDVPPYRPVDPDTELPVATAYADWLLAIQQRWIRDGRPMGIRIFDSISSTLRGGAPLSDALGLSPSDLLVIETDGEIEQVDSLKIAFEGAPRTGLHVETDGLEAAMAHPGLRARQNGVADLCQTCRSCEVVESCGGGLYPHRYRTGSGFENPSVYCADLKKLIISIADTGPAPSQAVHHVVDPLHLAQLASGFGGPAAIGQLADAQSSIARQLLAEVADRLAARSPSARAAWSLLVHLDGTHGQVLADVLAHPYFRAWAARVLGSPGRDGDEYYLAAIAMAAAVRAGEEWELPLAPRDGAVHLPTLGRVRLGTAAPFVRVTSASTPGLFTVHSGEAPRLFSVGVDGQRGWDAVATVSSEGFTVRLDDIDPERDCHQWPVAEPLGPDHRRSWQHAFERAWRLILDDYPDYAPGLAAGLTTVTPLAQGASGHEISATARQAPGAVAAALPARSERLALLLLHEYQHVKLGAVLDCFDLYDDADHRLYYAPWRDDPRPFEGLLQGTYAHLAVTDFWRVRATGIDGPEAEEAERHFARWRIHTAQAVEVLAGSGSLTALGRSFVDGMRTTVAPWLDVELGRAAEEAAQQSSARHLEAYRARTAGQSDR